MQSFSRNFRKLSRAGLALVAFMAMGLPSASAATAETQSDSSDNSFAFVYDAATGDVSEATSGATYTRDDPVSFFVYVRERKDAPAGERLLGLMTLHLNARKAVAYQGTFTLTIQDAAGATTVYTEDSAGDVCLKPRRGHRNARVKIPFDLPSGSYTATASFEA